ncbi:MAG: sodium/glutamate symporter, partial [Spirochaetales bacterium]|nr:sodium/glutamate symporter [Spirochaetales bacterium]
ISNTVPYLFKTVNWPSESASMAVVSDISLGLFLSMAMMGLDIRIMQGSVLPIVLLMTAQLVVIVLFSIFVVFPAMGKDYDAAVITSGYLGLGLGATPTALANMTALTHHFGASPRSFLIIPLMGAFFIDLVNSFVIEFFLKFIV